MGHKEPHEPDQLRGQGSARGRPAPQGTRVANPWRTEGERFSSFLHASRLEFNRCLEPSWQCMNRAIRAHSVQNSRVLDLLARNGHVVAPRLRASMHQGPQLEFVSVGRNRATTFTGLCAFHDNAIFRPIETSDLDLSNQEHLFLLAYRAATRELHATMQAAVQLQTAYQERVERGLDDENEMTPAGLEATAQILIAHQTFNYRGVLDDALHVRDFAALEHDVSILNVDRPTIAVSSLFSLDTTPVGDRVVLVHLNVFPRSQNETAVVWSYTPANAGMARAHLDRALISSGYHQLYEISRVVLRHCENLVLSPEYFDLWTPQKRQVVHDYFFATFWRSSPDLESAELFLF